MNIGDTQYTMDLFLTWLGSFIAEGYVGKTDRQFGALPQFVWHLSQRQSVILMNALLQGDDSAGYYTSSRRLAEDVQRLALHCGWSGTIELCKAKDGLVVQMAKNDNNPQVHFATEEYVRYTGQVGCIEVPTTHLFFYKEDLYSPPCWTGNSSRHGQKVRFLASTQFMATLTNRLPQIFFSGHHWIDCQRRGPAIHFSRYLPRHSHQ